MKNKNSFNGWTNRETWATALHIDNDEGLHQHRLELCAEAMKARGNLASPEKTRRWALVTAPKN